MIVANHTSILNNATISFEIANPCPKQRSITRPFLFVHNYALFFFGSIFNFLAFVILMRRALRCHSTFAYLAFLSLSNGLLSLVHFSKWMLQYYFHILTENILITCRFDRFLSDFLTHFSLFTLICVNIDRARTVTKICPSSRYPKSKFHLILMKEFLVATILCAFHFHWIIKYGSEVFDDEKQIVVCGYHSNQRATLYFYFLTTIYPPFELVVFFGLPLLINIVCTIIIMRSLSIRMRTAEKYRPSKGNLPERIKHRNSEGILSYILPRRASKTLIHSCFCFQIQCRRHTRLRLKVGRTQKSLHKYHEENATIDRQISTKDSLIDNQLQVALKTTSDILNKSHRSRRTRDIHLSAMLISLNVFYLLLNLPFHLHQTFAKHFHDPNPDPCNVMFFGLIFDTLQQTFFSINFFLYVLTNRRFREEFYKTMAIIISRCRQNSSRKQYNHRRSKLPVRSSSINISVAVRSCSNHDNLMIEAPSRQNHNSIVSDIESTTTSPTQQLQQTIVLINESIKCTQKLVMFKDLSTT
ncbi:unnamed protein product [Rotaria magnacalcarata]|uniref:G-protein coupled receptors family 1 profile domain-containing protein n=1 Tax=Rotaria magnacalcarata TaxID=392030 RepID=A0A815SI91_9BILA|nr:unnamed protein product [Rotaria magnacalcarata]CAF1630409.1 unnamed protein product [Rotaria magnacalcarata]CAF1923785.1 unnamed protein product [Rotaria magnacalcarata]CAF3897822.1 unnamed protein product [Rotaria magnacalcarata]CAF3980160.1 unnamed protein product [Rotaria magnacalcarata]